MTRPDRVSDAIPAIIPPTDVDFFGAPPVAPAQRLESDVQTSIRNGLKLGASLLVTWAVALGVRIVLPRYLGPGQFGVFQFADSFTTTAFILTSLGLETYVRKEVATRREHANEFFGGTMLFRIVIGCVVMAVAYFGLQAAGKPPALLRLVLVLGIAQMLVNLNGTYAALLHATGEVDGLSLLNVASKAVWGLGIVQVFAVGGGIYGVGVALLVSEILRTLGLAVLSRRHLALRFEVDVRATTAVIVASLPFYLAQLAQVVYAKIDVSIMSFIATDVEVGWYGAASNLAGMSLLLSPLIGWVLLPLTSRAAARSDEELTLVTRRAMELILIAAIPVTLFLGLGANVVVQTVFGRDFAPAARSLQILAPMFVLTYAAIVSASILVRLERGWSVTLISLSGMVVTPLLDLFLVPRCLAYFGAGGAGIGAAIALMITEVYTTVWLTALLGRRSFDRRSMIVLAKTALVCLLVVVVDRMLVARIHAWRLVVDAVLYAGLVVWWRAVDLNAMVDLVRTALTRRRVTKRERA